jgi:hypothetical protein
MRVIIDGANPLDFGGQIRIGGRRRWGTGSKRQCSETQRRIAEHEVSF